MDVKGKNVMTISQDQIQGLCRKEKGNREESQPYTDASGAQSHRDNP